MPWEVHHCTSITLWCDWEAWAAALAEKQEVNRIKFHGLFWPWNMTWLLQSPLALRGRDNSTCCPLSALQDMVPWNSWDLLLQEGPLSSLLVEWSVLISGTLHSPHPALRMSIVTCVTLNLLPVLAHVRKPVSSPLHREFPIAVMSKESFHACNPENFLAFYFM